MTSFDVSVLSYRYDGELTDYRLHDAAHETSLAFKPHVLSTNVTSGVGEGTVHPRPGSSSEASSDLGVVDRCAFGVLRTGHLKP